MIKAKVDWLVKQALPLAWLVAVVATLISLGLSLVFKLVPCELCWYQRIALYPLAIILGISFKLEDARAAAYGLPLSVIGLGLALYHSLLQWGVVTKDVLSCSLATPCTVAQIKWFGFITIPFMSFLTFGVITVLLLIYRKSRK